MPFIFMLFLAFSVSLDAFSVAVSGSIAGPEKPWRNSLLAAGFFGAFQFVMPMLGGIVGVGFGSVLDVFEHYAAFALLAFVGGKMIFESFHKTGAAKEKIGVFKVKSLLLLGVATSIDAAAVGASITLNGNPVMTTLLPAALTMGIFTAIAAFSGVWLGRRVGMMLGRCAEIAGGLILIAVGLNILISHLTA